MIGLVKQFVKSFFNISEVKYVIYIDKISIYLNYLCCLKNVIQFNKICKNIIKFVGLNFYIFLI